MSTPIYDRLQLIPKDSGFRQEGYVIWCASLIRDGDTYHLFASRWPSWASDPTSFRGALNGYRQHSEVVRATADSPMGPYTFQEVVLAGRGGDWWDGQACHNPRIVKVGERFVLYYIGIAVGSPLRKVGYAWADSVEGPWHRLDTPLTLTEDANNPAPYIHEDGSVLMAYRDLDLHMHIARADAYDAPYETVAYDIFPQGRLEDPYLYRLGGRYHIVLEDNAGLLTGHERFGAHLVSDDGLQWTPYDPVVVYDHTLRWTDGTTTQVTRRERPEFFFGGGPEYGEAPSHLITGVLVGGEAWAVVQEIAPPGEG